MKSFKVEIIEKLNIITDELLMKLKVSIKKIPKSTSYLYSKIVKDKNIISTLTDEELQLYSKEIEERYTVRIKSQKDELF